MYRIVKEPQYKANDNYNVEQKIGNNHWVITNICDSLKEAEEKVSELISSDAFYKANKSEVIKTYD